MNENEARTRGHVTLVVDRTGSMASIREEAEQGVNEYVKKQAESENVDVTVSLYQFNITFDHVFGPVAAADAPEYRLEPNNMTALYDAIGKGIYATQQMVDGADEKPDKVALVIMTDGQENSSREYNLEAVTKAISDAKDQGWEILFLSGDLASTRFGQGTAMATTGYNAQAKGATRGAYAAASAATTDFFEEVIEDE